MTIQFNNQVGIGRTPAIDLLPHNGFLKPMRPHEFLRLVPRKLAGFHIEESIKFMIGVLQSDKAIAMPFLIVEWLDNIWRVINHEGRARCNALNQLYPEMLVPVIIFANKMTLDDITLEMETALILPDVRVEVRGNATESN